MNELEKVKKIVDAFPDHCPYCFKKLKNRLYKPNSTAKPYCPSCCNFIDLEWDYLHAIAVKVKNYLVLEGDESILDFRKNVKQ
ncbi:MAG: hypothetical protein ACTSYC_07875 [Promethearchaeota archaeon]